MTNEQIAASLDQLTAKLDTSFAEVDRRFEHIEKNMVTKSDVFQTVIASQAVFYAGALAMIIVLNAIGALG